MPEQERVASTSRQEILVLAETLRGLRALIEARFDGIDNRMVRLEAQNGLIQSLVEGRATDVADISWLKRWMWTFLIIIGTGIVGVAVGKIGG